MTRRPARYLLFLIAGFSVWAAGFVVIYSALSIGCAAGWNEVTIGTLSLQRAIILGLLLAITATSVIVLRLVARPRPLRGKPVGFLMQLAYYTSLAAGVAILFTFSGVAVLSMCG